MGINKGAEFLKRDIFIDYDFEEVMFRWDHQEKIRFRKFYREDFETIITHDNRLYSDALLYYGKEISATEYFNGKPAHT